MLLMQVQLWCGSGRPIDEVHSTTSARPLRKARARQVKFEQVVTTAHI